MPSMRIYATVNNGVYKAGFATTQDAYEEAVRPLFATLDWLEKRLTKSRYLCGDRMTEADWRLFTTLVRFDPVYVGYFKCNLRRLVDYPNLWDYTRELFQYPGVAATVDFTHIKRHYYQSHKSINPAASSRPGPSSISSLPTSVSFYPLGARNRSAGCPFDRHHPEKTDERTGIEGNHRAL